MRSTLGRIKAAICMTGALLISAGAAWAQPANPSVVIAQIYGAGGNTGSGGATYNRDFIVLFNRTNAAIDLSTWSLQYGSSTGAVGNGASQIQVLSGSIPANGYLLVAGASGAANGTNPAGVALPAPIDVNNTTANTTTLQFSGLALSASAGKVALVNSTTGLNVANPLSPLAPSLVDFVGYGSGTNAFEGTGPAPAPSTTNMIVRASAGCTDTNNNSADFAAVALTTTPTSNILNSASATNPCSGATSPSGANSTTATEGCPTTDVTFSVTVTPSTGSNNAIASVVADFTSIGGTTGVTLSNGGSGLVYSSTQTINLDPTGATGVGNKTIPVVITDAAGRTGNASISIFVPNCTLGLTTGTGLALPAVCPGGTQTLTVVARPARIPAAQGTSTGITATADLSAFSDQGIAVSLGTPTGPDSNGNYTFTLSFQATPVAPFFSNGPFNVPVTLTDAQGRTNGIQATTAQFSILSSCADAASTVVISQVYGGGGNAGAQFNSDFVELFNRSSSAVDIGGWSLQYFSSGNTASGKFDIPAGTSIPAGRYLLIGLNPAPGAVGAAITPDLTVTTAISASATAGRFVLSRNTTQITGTPCANTNTDVADLVAYGGANDCFDGGSAAPTLSNTTAAFRLNNGCVDRNQNGADFTAAAPAPRNASTPANNCSGVVNNPPVVSAGSANPTSGCPGTNTLLSVVVTPGTGAITSVTANLAPLGGSTSVALTAGANNSYSVSAPIGQVAAGIKSITVTATDANNLTASTNITFTVNNCVPSSFICCRGATCSTVTAVGDCTAPAGIGALPLDPSVTNCNALGNPRTPCCYADFDKQGGRTIDDIFIYLNAWFADSPYAKVGTPGPRTIDDIFLFLNAWFGGC